MTSFFLFVAALGLGGLATLAPAQIVFGPVRSQPGQSIRMLSHSETPGGTIIKTTLGGVTRGSLAITGERDLVWTFRPEGADGSRRGMVMVNALSSTTTSVIAGKEDVTREVSPLTGEMFSMGQVAKGAWKFELDGSIRTAVVTEEIDEMTVYLKRQWLPEKPVKLGDSWEFDPAWVNLVVRRDLRHAKTIGTMKLRQVRRTETLQMAVIDVNIRGTGSDFRPDGTEAKATVELSGELTINLDTMLDEELVLKGKIELSTATATTGTAIVLPVTLRVVKSFVSEP